MIEPTDEMRQAFADAAGWPPAPWMFGPDVERGIAAVLALVERDYPLMKLCPTGKSGRCVAVAHSASNAGLCRSHGCVYPGTKATPPQ